VDPGTWGDTGEIGDLFTDGAKGQLKDDIATITLGDNAGDTYGSVDAGKSTAKGRTLTDKSGNALRAAADISFTGLAKHKDGTYTEITVTGTFFFVKDGDTWRIEGYSLQPQGEAGQGARPEGFFLTNGGGVVTRRFVAVVLVRAAWLAGPVAGSLGSSPAAASSPGIAIGKAHTAEYTPSLTGSKPIVILAVGSGARPGEDPSDRSRTRST
jgi:hypothetical protein